MSKPKSKGGAAAHPLLAAVIGQLPAPGTAFPTPQRIAWLKMMAQSFDLAYGPDAVIVVRLAGDDAAMGSAEPLAIPLRPAPAAAVPAPRKPHTAAGCDFYVDEQGIARCDHSNADGAAVPTPNRRVLAVEASGHEIYDYRGVRRDRQTVVWADESAGAEPGMVFCGPG